MSKPDLLTQTAKFLNDSNGRDKLSKIVQYGSRYLMFYFLSADPKSATGEKFKGLFAITRDSRKLVRLFKYLNEFATIQELLKKGGDPTIQALQISARIGWAQYWFFDNLVFLQKAKAYTTTTDLNYYGALGWFYALSVGLFMNVREFVNILDQEASLSKKYHAEKNEDTKKSLIAVRAKKTKAALSSIGNVGDLICAANGIQIPHKILGHGLSDGTLGIAGLVSALIAGYYRWQDLNA